MKCKVVSNGNKYKVLVKFWFWWIDVGFPTYDKLEDAERVVDENTTTNYKDVK